MPGRERPAVLSVCGWKGSGKTTLVAALARELSARGLRVLAVKRAGEALRLDRDGTDTARLFEAGADVLAFGPGECLLRRHGAGPLAEALAELGGRYDVVLIEGHKAGPGPKLWLLGEGECAPPPGVRGVLACLGPGEGRLARALEVVSSLLKRP